MDKKNDHTDAAYKLDDLSESATHFSGTTSSKDPASALLEKTQRHHIFLIVFIIFASLGIYKIVGKLLHSMYATSKPTLVAVQKHAAAAAITPAAVQANRALDDRFNHLEQEQRELQMHVQSLDSDLSDIKSTLAELNSRLMNINEQTQLLYTQQDAFLKTQKKAETKRIERKKSTPQPVYYVRAIIPGRVWLTLQDGSTLTLGMGDQLTGYGVITAIDPNQGTITLSSGAVIGYHPDDR